MRMDRGTVLLLVVSLVVIVAVLALTINQAAAPSTDTTNTGEITATPEVLFPVADAEAIVRIEVRDDLTGQRTVLERAEAGGEWALQADTEVDGDVDQARVAGLATALLGLQGQDSFEVDDLEQYGLTHPTHSIYAVADEGTIYVMHLGARNPQGNRYYAVVEQLAAGTTRADLNLMQPLVQRLEVPTSLDEDNALGDTPADPTLSAMVEMMAEATDEAAREEIAATYGAIIEATNAAGGMSDRPATAEATAAADDADPQATDSVQADGELQPLLERSDVDTSETTLEPDAIDAIDATPAPALTEEAEETAEPVRDPLVTLSAPQRVYLINTSAVQTLLAILDSPPVVVPLEMPTETPPSLIPEELTDEAPVPDAGSDEAEEADEEPEATETAA